MASVTSVHRWAWVGAVYVGSALLTSLLFWVFGEVETYLGGLALAALGCLGIPLTEGTVALWLGRNRRRSQHSP